MNIDRHIATEIKVKRVMAGLSQEGLALRVGTQYGRVEMWESGFLAVTAAELFTIATVLRVDIAVFYPKQMAEAAE